MLACILLVLCVTDIQTDIAPTWHWRDLLLVVTQSTYIHMLLREETAPMQREVATKVRINIMYYVVFWILAFFFVNNYHMHALYCTAV